jgi:transcriptional regulatory protein LevR
MTKRNAAAELDDLARDVAEEFRDRLDMLEDSGQTTKLARWMTESTLARIGQEFRLTLTEANAAQFTTHLAMAFGRLQRGEAEPPLSAALQDEVREHAREREVVRRILGECESLLQREVPDSELDYVTVHLCALMEDA